MWKHRRALEKAEYGGSHATHTFTCGGHTMKPRKSEARRSLALKVASRTVGAVYHALNTALDALPAGAHIEKYDVERAGMLKGTSREPPRVS